MRSTDSSSLAVVFAEISAYRRHSTCWVWDIIYLFNNILFNSLNDILTRQVREKTVWISEVGKNRKILTYLKSYTANDLGLFIPNHSLTTCTSSCAWYLSWYHHHPHNLFGWNSRSHAQPLLLLPLLYKLPAMASVYPSVWTLFSVLMAMTLLPPCLSSGHSASQVVSSPFHFETTFVESELRD